MGRGRVNARGAKRRLSFVDVFAGCGGMSLGLFEAGWTGQFAIEKNRDAFNTLAKNLIDGKRHSFAWPSWLPRKACTTRTFLAKYGRKLGTLKGKINLIAGAPPCQGFSLAGRRLHSDPRNSLFKEYLQIVNQVRPRFLLVENVQGFSFPFRKTGGQRTAHKPYSDVLANQLANLGYTTFSELVNFSEYGVPQNRTRFVLLGIRKGDPAEVKLKGCTPFELLRRRRTAFLRSRHLSVTRPTSARQAIVDLETKGCQLADCPSQPYSGFKEIMYAVDRSRPRFVVLMQRHAHGSPDSLRLPRHKPRTIRQFEKIILSCRQGQSLNQADRARLGIKKRALTPLHPKRPASTVTTLPDDIIHYSEPRILTVRENARLQSFPDWFEFTGDYTTGGDNRRRDCPRYTQVGNAVPPLFAEAIGLLLRQLAS